MSGDALALCSRLAARGCAIMPAMIGLTDTQLGTVMDMARTVPFEKRDLYLQRIAAMLKLRRPFRDADVVEAAQLAMAGLVQRVDSVA
jgi:hypothetical protein